MQPVSAASTPTSPKAVAIDMEPSPPASPGAQPAGSRLRVLFRPLFGSQAPPLDTPSTGEASAEQGTQLQVASTHTPSPTASEVASEVMGRERGNVLVELRRQSSPSLVRSDSSSSLYAPQTSNSPFQNRFSKIISLT